MSSKIYGRKWTRLREHVLRRDGYRSQIAARYGRNVAADTVHHILPVEYFPEYMYCSWNLLSMSSKEHNAMHERDGHRLTSAGMELVYRLARARRMDIQKIKERLDEGQIQKETV